MRHRPSAYILLGTTTLRPQSLFDYYAMTRLFSLPSKHLPYTVLYAASFASSSTLSNVQERWTTLPSETASVVSKNLLSESLVHKACIAGLSACTPCQELLLIRSCSEPLVDTHIDFLYSRNIFAILFITSRPSLCYHHMHC